MAKILIVDDDPSICMLFRYVLADSGHEVETASDGQAALALLEEFTPDAMLLDISMPGMSGPELARGIRKLAAQRPQLARIPYWVMTGENYLSETADFGFEKDKNFMKYIPKMTPPEDVLVMVEAALGL
jgi:CheY-like chemotaxis protein